MIRSSILAAVMASTLFTVACDKASGQQKKVTEARTEANDKILEAQREADRTMEKAGAQEAKKVAEADSALAKLREDYRHKTTENLTELERKMVALESKATESKGAARSKLDRTLKQVGAQRAAFLDEYKTLEGRSGEAWDQTTTRLDKAWSELEALIDGA